MACCLGVMAADQVLMWLAVAGVATLLAAYPAAFHAVQWVGAAYLAWLGYKLLTARPGDAPAIQIQPRQYFRQGALITLMNPKAIVLHGLFPDVREPGKASGAADLWRDGGHGGLDYLALQPCRRDVDHGAGRASACQPGRGEAAGKQPVCFDRFWPQAGHQLKEKFNGQDFLRCQSKGGVGKTTTTVNLAAGLAKVGQRVLLIDLDPQGNATMGSGVDKRALELSVYDVLLENASIKEVAQKSEQVGYDVLGANRELSGAEIELVSLDRRNDRLKAALQSVDADYDFVLIDCPPSLSMLTLNGLCSAHGVIVPMQCEYFALEGLTDLVNTIKQVHANMNPDLQIIGLLRVMFDPRTTLQQQVSDQLKEHFGDKVFDTVIPRNVRLAEAPSYGLPGVVFDASAKGSKAFIEFAQEMVRRIKKM